MIRSAIVVALVLLSSCQGERRTNAIPPELVEAQRYVWLCGQDVQWTYPERSEHCVLAAETLLNLKHDDCTEKETHECLTWQANHTDLALGYQIAISGSLFERGKSPEISGVESGVPGLIYRDSDLMRRLFERCIKDEQHDLEAVGLVKVSSIVERPLEDGQSCFRKGYPEFKTKKATTS